MTMPPPPQQPPQPPYSAYALVPPMRPEDEKMWATLTHLSGIFTNWIGPLVAYLVLRDRGPFVRAHTAAALNFQLTMLIAAFVSGILSFFGIGILLLIAVGVLVIVIGIIGAVKANQGQWYTPPLTIRFVS
ncbi:DUF4870 domain-containing protein [Microbacterium sp. EYE_5]|uniref:DUF4870 domain-containing protein n=1 Tax=unclassified Microbacterium TaxID=2609290 RepID=UPI002005F95A|nr:MULTISPECIES: DUF4870 domain-containing protein [unclassified Microbacterium]MCK6079235.1 DUF4870 domain-containing protein [Microbacterium sp. EYE_382]MCK6084505.1 DUF4870 domain-containing protein [Microbacterium sp. EYE_384]MCK6123266.1 DUF4870 domain-containing protein [Microbacterium sp. EYE_80]MCK6125269.1 DUF4870 domain-containing protein [Microbacterium sp. EYE_79]MCK6140189.1 DUF4870 domain-containing protein [Microbacterium sp. EYE_39]